MAPGSDRCVVPVAETASGEVLEDGSQGFGLTELAIVLEELGYAMAPGPFLPTTLAAALLALPRNEAARGAFLPGLAGVPQPWIRD